MNLYTRTPLPRTFVRRQLPRTEQPPMQPFIVSYVDCDGDPWDMQQFFECDAENESHARAQLTTAYPRAVVMWVGPGPNYTEH